MSVVVMAYHQMGCAGLRVLLRRRIPVSAVFTHDDDPDENCWFESVAEIARLADIPTYTPERINSHEWRDLIAAMTPDVILSFHYRHIVGAAIRAIPPHGSINLHASLLPKYRGRSPINWQLLRGERRSGVTLHHMTKRPDAGDIVDQEPVAVDSDDQAIDLYRKLVPAAERLLDRNLDTILRGTAPRRPQVESEASTFGGRRPEDGRIDWSRGAREIHNLVRAVAPPWPGAYADTPEGRLFVDRSRAHDRVAGLAELRPGQLACHDEAWFAGTGDGVLELLEFRAPIESPLTRGSGSRS